MNNRVLKNRAFNSHNEDLFRHVFNNIEEYVSHNHITKLIDRTCSDILRITKGKSCAIAWSGGKDSVALRLVAEQAGITDSVIGYTNLEYKLYMDWLAKNAPKGISKINTGHDLNWLVENEHFLFPATNQISSRWYKFVQQRSQDIYFNEKKLDIILLGRRKADSNYVGRNGENIYTNKKGITRYSPISEWSHEEVIAAIRYYNLPIAPFYEMPRAFYLGTHPWAFRDLHPNDKENDSRIETWKEVLNIEKETVIEASYYFDEAKILLDEVG
jgi:3'-phosphoadenosine 5'-phosphosulfate sulfotransferase (PAPS reductase)/FAD synthetase